MGGKDVNWNQQTTPGARNIPELSTILASALPAIAPLLILAFTCGLQSRKKRKTNKKVPHRTHWMKDD
jgi:hypothetical protein